MTEENLEIYTTLEDAKEEIQKRWNDKELRKKVEEYLGEIPEPFKNEPRAVLFRNIITSDMEIRRFLEMASELKLKPLGLEYVKDKFCTRSQDKLSLGKLPIFEKLDKNGNAIIRYEKIIDVKKCDNQPFDEIETFAGKKLVDFHHDAVKNDLGEIEIVDMSEWIKNNGQKASEYYKKFFAFFICHGVLFENFLFDGEEDKFTENAILPALEFVCKDIGVTLLILPALPIENYDAYWQGYPDSIIKFLK